MSRSDPILRGSTYQLYRRVPRRYASVEDKPFVRISLHTDSRDIARRKALLIWESLIEGWEAKLDGHDKEGEARLAAAANLAAKKGFRFLQADEVAQLPVREILNRLAVIPDEPKKADLPIIEAALGTPPRSSIKVSEAINHFYKVAGDKVLGKSEDQLRKHQNPRKMATANFIKAVGDVEVAKITAEDMWEFRQWLTTRVRKGEIKAASANKDITHVNAMWKVVSQSKGFRLGYTTEGLALDTSGDEEDTRPPFSSTWIKDKILKEGALGGMNAEARLVLLGMVNTGYRPGEGAGLTADEIRLDSNVPHIVIQPNRNRALKTPQSRRTIPLTGVSLDAFRQAKAGFPRYADNSATLSGTVNKFLRENKLLETDEHVMYSLRHSFEDRMLEAGIDERIRRDMLGHKLNRERYGSGGSLDHIHGLLAAIAF